jgi:hypothetical protein
MEPLMPVLAIVWPGESVSDEEIAEFEEDECVTLPEDYKAFLRDHNGGRPIPDAFPIGGGSIALMEMFFELGSAGDARPHAATRDLQTVWREHANAIPEDMMPIGKDTRGSVLCLGTGARARTTGRIYLVDPTKLRPTYEIAPSFSALFGLFVHRPRAN